jgi:hypothetical protein
LATEQQRARAVGWLLRFVQTETVAHHDRFDGGPEVSRGAHQLSVDYRIVWQSERLGVANSTAAAARPQ